MKTMLAALDASPVARPVLESALGMAELIGADVRAVHVGRADVEPAARAAAQRGVPLQIIEGPLRASLVAAVARAETVMGVFGARATHGGRRPVGSTASGVLERADKPILVVPPEAVGVSPRPFRRVLAPLEGTEMTSRPLTETLFPLLTRRVELVVLHVFTPATVPRTLDRAHRDLTLLGDEFLARFCPEAAHIELRTGWAGARVTEVCDEQRADLIVLSWSPERSADRGSVIRDVLAHANVPVLLLPAHGATGVERRRRNTTDNYLAHARDRRDIRAVVLRRTRPEKRSAAP